MSSVDKGSDFFTSVQSVKRAISLEQVFRRKNPHRCWHRSVSWTSLLRSPTHDMWLMCYSFFGKSKKEVIVKYFPGVCMQSRQRLVLPGVVRHRILILFLLK